MSHKHSDRYLDGRDEAKLFRRAFYHFFGITSSIVAGEERVRQSQIDALEGVLNLMPRLMRSEFSTSLVRDYLVFHGGKQDGFSLTDFADDSDVQGYAEMKCFARERFQMLIDTGVSRSRNIELT